MSDLKPVRSYIVAQYSNRFHDQRLKYCSICYCLDKDNVGWKLLLGVTGQT